mgnify:CR=1 FL=1
MPVVATVTPAPPSNGVKLAISPKPTERLELTMMLSAVDPSTGKAATLTPPRAAESNASEARKLGLERILAVGRFSGRRHGTPGGQVSA